MQQPYVCVYASQVAVCIGANRHKKASDALEAMWARINPAGYRAALARNGLRTEDQNVTEILARAPGVKALVDKTVGAACASSDDVAERYDSVARELRGVREALTPDEERLVDDVLKRNLYTTYGTQHEHRALRHIRDALHIDCHADPTFYKQRAGTVRGVPWFVGGKIDAITADRTLLVEIKNRVNRLFYRVPFYEVVQVQTYLELLGLEQGVLVECLNSRAAPPPADLPAPPRASNVDGGTEELHTNVVSIRRDRDLWTREIMPKLEAFVDYLLQLVGSAKMQDRYLQSPRRSVLVLNHISQR